MDALHTLKQLGCLSILAKRCVDVDQVFYDKGVLLPRWLDLCE